MAHPRLLPNPGLDFPAEDIERCLADRFEQQAERTPQRLAVRTPQEDITYDALNRLANGIAGDIVQRKLPPGPIALLAGQGIDMVAAMLGVWKAGRAFVPLEGHVAEPRLRHILEGSDVPLLLTDPAHRALARSLADGRPILDLAEARRAPAPQAPLRTLGGDALAFVLWTSGSTGEPKGVMHDHRTMLHTVWCYAHYLRIGPEDRVAVLNTICHNTGIIDVLKGLYVGATVLLYPLRAEGHAGIADWLARERVTILRCVPTVLREIVADRRGSLSCPALRLLHLAGEPVLASDVALFRKHFPASSALLVNLGSTETMLISLWFLEPGHPAPQQDVMPVGYPAAGKEVLLLDDTGRPAAWGSCGEIVVRSRYLALGYWKRPDLTEVAFFPDPEAPGQRCYRTGDRGRLLPDGCLEYLGRKDSQVKVRGQRVELADIEQTLVQLPSVRAAAVTVREDRPGDPCLVAYVVAASAPGPSVVALRAELQTRLPEHMIPTTFVFLDALPRTSFGKIDRQALPKPGRNRPRLDTPFVPPASPLEQEIAAVWCAVLNLDAVGVHDSFLELGGHSLRALQVLARLRDGLAVEVTPREFLQAPTVAGLALTLTQRLASQLDAAELEALLAEVEDAGGSATEGPA